MYPVLFNDLLSFDSNAYRFHRPMLEREGYFAIEKDGKVFILLNVLGVDKKDIKVDVKSAQNNKEAIAISGSTKDEIFDREFSVGMTFIIGKPMEKIEWDVANGFLTLEIAFKEPVQPSVKVISK